MRKFLRRHQPQADQRRCHDLCRLRLPLAVGHPGRPAECSASGQLSGELLRNLFGWLLLADVASQHLSRIGVVQPPPEPLLVEVDVVGSADDLAQLGPPGPVAQHQAQSAGVGSIADHGLQGRCQQPSQHRAHHHPSSPATAASCQTHRGPVPMLAAHASNAASRAGESWVGPGAWARAAGEQGAASSFP